MSKRQAQRNIRRLAIILMAALLAFFAVMLFAPRADAHRGYASTAGYIIRHSNMNGQCGNGLLSYCYPEFNTTYDYVAADAHTWKMRGYWQERRIGHGRFVCRATFLAGPHGRGWIPATERCYKL